MLCAEVETAQVAIDATEHRLPGIGVMSTGCSKHQQPEHRVLCAEVEAAQVATSIAEHRLPAHRCYEHRLL